MGKRAEKEWPRTISFGAGRVRISQRANGAFALHWREMGSTRRTTKSSAEKALKWAAEKARQLDAGTGQRWVSGAEAEAVAALRSMAGQEEGAMHRLVEDLRGAMKWLGGHADLMTAARWYAENGPLKTERVTVGEAATRWLAEYDAGSKETRRTFGQEVDGFLDAGDGDGRRQMALLDLSEGMLLAWVTRKVRGKDAPAPRTLLGRITTWVTFLNRCREWKMLPTGPHAADVLRKPTIPDAGREIFSVDQGRKLLAAVREHDSKLEGYLLIAGWLGLRPSEIQRLTWSGFDWDRGYLHVTHEVAGKTASERYVPMEHRLNTRLHGLFLASGGKAGRKVARFRSREFLSLLARKHGVCAAWPTDVLRHSFCSYRIAVCKSLPQVAEEAGNSVEMLKAHYRRPLRHEDGLAWWDLLD